MFYGDKVQDTRQLFFSSWAKFQQKKPLLPLEQQIVDVIISHPEYQCIIENPKDYQNTNFFPEMGETNPFLHMGLHLAIREQVATDRPAGMARYYGLLIDKIHDPMKVEHLMMDQLAETIWLAQKNHQMPDEQAYLNRLKTLCSC